MPKAKTITIPNWTFFGTKNVIMDLYKHTCEEHGDNYNVVMSFILEDGEDDHDGEDLKCISIITHINVSTIDEAINQGAESIGGLFEDYHAIVTIYDAKTSKSINEINLNDYFGSDNDSDDLTDLTMKTTPPGTVIH